MKENHHECHCHLQAASDCMDQCSCWGHPLAHSPPREPSRPRHGPLRGCSAFHKNSKDCIYTFCFHIIIDDFLISSTSFIFLTLRNQIYREDPHSMHPVLISSVSNSGFRSAEMERLGEQATCLLQTFIQSYCLLQSYA